MKRVITVAGLALVFAAMFGLYELSYRVDRQEARLRELTSRIAAEKQSIAVLRAEWAYLTRPQAIQNRAVEHLGMLPPLPRQLVGFDAVPARQERLITDPAAPRMLASVDEEGMPAPLPKRRPEGLPQLPEAEIQVAVAQVAAPRPAALQPVVTQVAATGREAPRAAAPVRPAPQPEPQVVQAVHRPAAPSQSSTGRAGGGLLLPAEMEAHLLKVAARQLSGGAAPAAPGAGR